MSLPVACEQIERPVPLSSEPETSDGQRLPQLPHLPFVDDRVCGWVGGWVGGWMGE